MRTNFKTARYSKIKSLGKIHIIYHKIFYSITERHLFTCDTHCLPVEHFNPYVRKKIRKIKEGKYALLSETQWVWEYK